MLLCGYENHTYGLLDLRVHIKILFQSKEHSNHLLELGLISKLISFISLMRLAESKTETGKKHLLIFSKFLISNHNF